MQFLNLIPFEFDKFTEKRPHTPYDEMTNTASNTERRGYLNVNTSNNLIMASGRIENQTPYYT